MKFCKNCGETLDESSNFCTNCFSRVVKAENNITSVPISRMEKRKGRSKRLVAGVGTIIGILFVLCAAFLIIKNYTKHEPTTNISATVNQSKDNHLKNNSESSKAANSTDKNPTEENKKESSNPSSSDYIFPDSDKKMLSEEDIATLTKEQLLLARNEIYARHGYVFKTKELQDYFSSKSWYHADSSFDGTLNEVEIKNVMLIKTREDRQ